MGCSKSSSKMTTIYFKKQEVSDNLKLKQKPKVRSNKERKKEKKSKDQGRNNWKRNEAMIAKVNKTKSWFFDKENKVDKPLAKLVQKKSERTQINKIRNEKRRSYNWHWNKES